jgi:hypothetical protein
MVSPVRKDNEYLDFDNMNLSSRQIHSKHICKPPDDRRTGKALEKKNRQKLANLLLVTQKTKNH